jgi:cytochrome c oxidase subunit II
MSDQTPLAYLTAAGPQAGTIVPLTWFMLIVSVLVCVVIGGLLWIASRRGRTPADEVEARSVALTPGPPGISWIRVGLLFSAVPLFVALVWTMVTLAAVSGPPRAPHDAQLVLDVTGHQWWWEVVYSGADPSQTFSTANEIHVPTGARVLVRLHGADVIHSFWVPKLAGKTDTIPGQTNLAWFEAKTPGRYRGQCTEYCGMQHAHMGLEVVAESSADFEHWRQLQLSPAATPTNPAQSRGRELVEFRCGLCHQVRGTTAGARAAPDLTHVAGRRTLAAGVVPNNAGTLSGWIENPQGFKPGSLMPNQNLSGQQLSDVVAYLETLR